MPLTQPIKGDQIEGLKGYTLVKEINTGHFGRVLLAKEVSTGEEVACKIVEKTYLNKRQKENMLNEISILRQLSHPNIIKFKDSVETSQYFVIVMELMKGGDLFDRLIAQKAFLEEDARLIMLQIAQAINYVHQQGIAHRDLKIENVMFLEPHLNIVKLGDFGLAKRIGQNSTRTPVGTEKYMAPEIIKGEYYSTKVDIWALGCLVFILLYGTFPFFNETDRKGNRLIDVTEKIKTGYFKFPQEGAYENEPVSETAKDLIRKCLVVDPSKRIDIQDFLKHPWITTQSSNQIPLHSPAALRTAQGLVSMRDYFNFGVHAERNRLDGDDDSMQIEDQLHSESKLVKLGNLGQSKILKNRIKRTDETQRYFGAN